jgi:threonine dehydratase
VFAKLENTQPTGSFKVRGATAKLMSLSRHQLAAGVVAASTGNHGAAVAWAATRLGTQATVYVSDTASASKVTAIRRLGATVVTIAGEPLQAELAARDRATTLGNVYVSPYNDATVVAGQGTIALELLRQQPTLRTVVVSVGGGGLISGIAATLKHHRPEIRVVAASAVNSAAMHNSVAAGAIIDVTHLPTLSDGTAGGLEPGTITFQMCRDLVDRWILIDEDSITSAMGSFALAGNTAIEGSAGVALAAVSHLEGRGPVAVVICGGNQAARASEAADS